ncbi:ANTAR domain-containing protein [Streptomyces actuosus]|uniref:ANTAR domain-containing protein n=1 Tax=Streptomyces actuosus TaxID=1885 RepID=UPI0027DA33F7|nr:ANTAR domain-containing protein [Streptomyces actuosus]
MDRHIPLEIRLAAALVEAADTLDDGFDTGRYLQRISDHCVDLLSARAAGVMLIGSGGPAALAGSSRHQETALDLLRAQHRGGPCRDSCVTGRPVPPVSIRDAHTDARWPHFTERALAHEVAATFAVPLRHRGTLLGALNVFAPALPGAPASDGPAQLRVTQAPADAAAVGLHNRRAFAEYRALSRQLQRALSTRIRIEQAKGMLSERWGTTADEAFAALRRHARRRRVPLDEVVLAVVERTADDAELNREARYGRNGDRRDPGLPGGPA